MNNAHIADNDNEFYETNRYILKQGGKTNMFNRLENEKERKRTLVTKEWAF